MLRKRPCPITLISARTGQQVPHKLLRCVCQSKAYSSSFDGGDARFKLLSVFACLEVFADGPDFAENLEIQSQRKLPSFGIIPCDRKLADLIAVRSGNRKHFDVIAPAFYRKPSSRQSPFLRV
jgi:hypothetical protein